MAASEGMLDPSLPPGSHISQLQYKGLHHKGLYEMHKFISTGLWPPWEQRLLAANTQHRGMLPIEEQRVSNRDVFLPLVNAEELQTRTKLPGEGHQRGKTNDLQFKMR